MVSLVTMTLDIDNSFNLLTQWDACYFCFPTKEVIYMLNFMLGAFEGMVITNQICQLCA